MSSSRFALALAFGLASGPAFAGTMLLLNAGPATLGAGPVMMVTPVLSLGSQSSGNFPSTTVIGYNRMAGGSGNGTWTATLVNTQIPIAVAGTFSNLSVNFQTSASPGTYDVTLYKAGTKSALTCTATTTCTSAATVAVAPGDLLNWGTCPSNTATCTAGSAPTVSALPPAVSATFTSTVGQESPLFGGMGALSLSASVPNYLGLGTNHLNATEQIASSVMPAGGTIDQLYVQLNGSSSPGNYVMTLFKNGVATGLTCTITSTTLCNDTNAGHAVTVVRGDTISLEGNPNTTPTARQAYYGLRWKPASQNQALLFYVAATVPITNATRFLNLSGGSGNDPAETSDINIAPVNMTLGNLTLAQCPGPGASFTRTVQLRSAQTTNQTPAITVPIGSTACPTLTTGTDATSYSPTAGTIVDYTTTVTGANTALTTLKLGMTATVP